MGIANEPREQTLLKQFYDGLQDSEMSFHICFVQKPSSLDSAVDLAEEFRRYKVSNKSEAKIRAVSSTDESTCKSEVSQLCDAIKSMLPLLQNNPQPTSGG